MYRSLEWVSECTVHLKKEIAIAPLMNYLDVHNGKDANKLHLPARIKAMSPKSKLQSQKTMHAKTMCPTYDGN